MHAPVRTVSHFERLHDQMLCADALSPQPGVDGDLTGILDLYFHEDHPEKILFAGPAMSHWITEDFGRTYQKVRLLPKHAIFQCGCTPCICINSPGVMVDPR